MRTEYRSSRDEAVTNGSGPSDNDGCSTVPLLMILGNLALRLIGIAAHDKL